MPVVGVTGTNGKTTTAYLLASILDAAGLKAGLLGTVTYRLGGEEREASRTTPEAPDVQQLLDEMIRQGCKSAVMEVSSHALALKRVDGMRFAAGDLHEPDARPPRFPRRHGDVLPAKRRLFEMLPRDAPGVINLDDPRGVLARRDLSVSRSRSRSDEARRRDAGTARDHAGRPDVRHPHAARHRGA